MELTKISSLLALAIAILPVKCQDALGLSQGYIPFQIGGFKGKIIKSSQTLASLATAETGYDFLPYDLITNLSINGAHQLGDITIRYKTSSGSLWNSVNSASSRQTVTSITNLTAGSIAGANLGPTLGKSATSLRIERYWFTEDNTLALRFNITNKASENIEIGSLGLPVSINNIFTNRPAEETQAKCSFADPYIGLHAGYVRISPLRGIGSALAIVPLDTTQFEAWRFLEEPLGSFGYQSQTFEGNYEWQIHSLAYAQNEWKNSTPWNVPTSKILVPGEAYSVGFKFALASSIQTIEDTVVKTGTPLAVGVPGYIIPQDSDAYLYLNHTSTVKKIDTGDGFRISTPSNSNGAYRLVPNASAWGRHRVTITYNDNKTQAIHYYITKSAPLAVASLGQFLTTNASYNNTSDPFSRAPSILTYDREANAVVEQDGRVWIAGLSDEGGTGAYLAAALKQFVQPVAEELDVLDAFIHETLVGTIQQNGSFGVVASAFFYEPQAVPNYDYNGAIDWTSWTSWNRERAYTTRRAYNYVHPVAAYWAFYRVARTYPEHKFRAGWEWYLGRAYNTTQYCLSNGAANCDYGLVGLMGETVLGELLEDLKRETMVGQARALEASMKYRASLWDTQAVPFGSEMAWDSTGQEGVYYWSNYFNLTSTATKAIHSILAYMPSVAHWGWNGNARRYWDFVYAAKIQQIERQIHHYGSALNSLPMISHYEQNPSDLYTLRIAYAGNTAPLSNIDETGFPSAAFHSYPDLLKWDPYTGDYGPGFLALSLGQATYVLNDSRYKDLVFGGNLDTSASNASIVTVEPRDAVRRRVFIAKLGLKIELSAGSILRIQYNKNTEEVSLDVAPASTNTSLQAKAIVVWLKQPGASAIQYEVSGAIQERGGWAVKLNGNTTHILITKT